ncbi:MULTISPECIES: 3-isopropylmalate dehydratase small subunit [unclassified Oceanispirochaeta]|uniref:3-isopropylmalate dehydratase small subunit n=1 Tax=unclassified Oceanispirochaeta TaxID=2635722 RepID=UPI000E08E283|nr:MULTISPECIES: 3-isopropylmalate dehydratase small subunit [unclassified Oceanispirochaeta]MBF9018583.1 3-isopropylmalate dehydratase small subunit [Oceanispirochaeta sp. M2]NPD75010.1 3-isopropylmalate dehydratase small subunit [Oceanispirochaeta sp. M1]RDG29131.1 3-isopropylmalate dehydratase small subunit [Oceanispirochaeta sp. M1]
MNEKAIRELNGLGVSVPGNDIDTDRIIPARFLKEITFSRMGEYPFFDERFNEDGSEKDHPFNKNKDASFLIGNDNFGCGSSREHAPQALLRWGIEVVLAESLAEIFAGNCAMIGLAAVTLNAGDIKEIQTAVERDSSIRLSLDLMSKKVHCGERIYEINIPESRRQALTEGTWDNTSLLLDRLDKAKATAASLPYMNNFNS